MTIRSYASNVSIHFGPATCTGLLKPVQASVDNSKKTYMVNEKGERCTQLYRDPDGNIYMPDELHRGLLQDDGTYLIATKEAVSEAKESDLPKNMLELAAHRTEEVEDYLYPSDHKSYIFIPGIKSGKVTKSNPVNDKWYDFIVTVVREARDITLLGRAKISRSNEAVYRLGIHRGYLLFQRVLFPEELNEYEPIRPTLAPTEEKKAVAIAHKLVTEFNVDDLRDTTAERLAEAFGADFDPTTPSKIQKIEPNFDLEAVLDAWGD